MNMLTHSHQATRMPPRRHHNRNVQNLTRIPPQTAFRKPQALLNRTTYAAVCSIRKEKTFSGLTLSTGSQMDQVSAHHSSLQSSPLGLDESNSE